ncbi:MAG: hypothetical protein IT464_07130 [Planctomycetes bacterium]|nr:hypothetical protein [Planctomycetota bacterium]
MSRWITLFASLTAVAALPLLLVSVRGERHIPAPTWVKSAKAQSGDWKWSSASTGAVKGKVNFSAKRPNQPMVVYLVKVDDAGKVTTQGQHAVPAELKVSQKGAKFDPGFAVLTRGQDVTFENDEEKAISHNVYFLGDIELDLGIFEQGAAASHTFEDYGEISVHCSIHKRMDAKFFVAPNPAYALLDGDGETFEIKGVPVGKYKLLTWQKQKRFKDVDMAVEIKDGATVDVIVEMTR